MADTHEASVAQSLVAKIVSSYVRKNRIAPADMSALINRVHQLLMALTKQAEPEEGGLTRPAARRRAPA